MVTVALGVVKRASIRVVPVGSVRVTQVNMQDVLESYDLPEITRRMENEGWHHSPPGSLTFLAYLAVVQIVRNLAEES